MSDAFPYSKSWLQQQYEQKKTALREKAANTFQKVATVVEEKAKAVDAEISKASKAANQPLDALADQIGNSLGDKAKKANDFTQNQVTNLQGTITSALPAETAGKINDKLEGIKKSVDDAASGTREYISDFKPSNDALKENTEARARINKLVADKDDAGLLAEMRKLAGERLKTLEKRRKAFADKNDADNVNKTDDAIAAVKVMQGVSLKDGEKLSDEQRQKFQEIAFTLSGAKARERISELSGLVTQTAEFIEDDVLIEGAKAIANYAAPKVGKPVINASVAYADRQGVLGPNQRHHDATSEILSGTPERIKAEDAIKQLVDAIPSRGGKKPAAGDVRKGVVGKATDFAKKQAEGKLEKEVRKAVKKELPKLFETVTGSKKLLEGLGSAPAPEVVVAKDEPESVTTVTPQDNTNETPKMTTPAVTIPSVEVAPPPSASSVEIVPPPVATRTQSAVVPEPRIGNEPMVNGEKELLPVPAETKKPPVTMNKPAQKPAAKPLPVSLAEVMEKDGGRVPPVLLDSTDLETNDFTNKSSFRILVNSLPKYASTVRFATNAQPIYINLSDAALPEVNGRTINVTSGQLVVRIAESDLKEPGKIVVRSGLTFKGYEGTYTEISSGKHKLYVQGDVAISSVKPDGTVVAQMPAAELDKKFKDYTAARVADAVERNAGATLSVDEVLKSLGVDGKLMEAMGIALSSSIPSVSGGRSKD